MQMKLIVFPLQKTYRNALSGDFILKNPVKYYSLRVLLLVMGSYQKLLCLHFHQIKMKKSCTFMHKSHLAIFKWKPDDKLRSCLLCCTAKVNQLWPNYTHIVNITWLCTNTTDRAHLFSVIKFLFREWEQATPLNVQSKVIITQDKTLNYTGEDTKTHNTSILNISSQAIKIFINAAACCFSWAWD